MRKWKLVIFALTFIIFIGIGTTYYFLEIKKYNVTDEKIEEITKNEYVLDLPEEEIDSDSDQVKTDTTFNTEESNDPIVIDSIRNEEETEEEEEEKKETVPSSVKKEEPKDNKTNNNNNNNNNEETKPVKKEVTVASIKEKYRPTFEDLEAQANQKINSIINRAIEEFQEKRANNEKVSFSYFYSKYNDAGKSLEAKTDSAFEVAYAALEQDLKKHGYSASHAKEFRTAYEEKKAERRNALFRKALEVL